MNYPQLKTLLETPAYSSLSAEEAAGALNEATIEKFRSVPTAVAANYLMTTLSSVPSEAPLTLYNRLSITYRNSNQPEHIRAYAESVIDLANGQIATAELHGALYNQMGDALVQAGVWTSQEKANILALGRYYVSVTEEQFGEFVTAQQVSAARNYDEYLQLQTERDQLLQQAHVKQEIMDEILRGDRGDD